jgi:hypothetical protein
MLSERRGWLQQLLDQYSGHNRLVAQQQLTRLIEDQQRERPVQHPASVVAGELAQMPDLTVRLVHEDQRLGIRCYLGSVAMAVKRNLHRREHSRSRHEGLAALRHSKAGLWAGLWAVSSPHNGPSSSPHDLAS